MTDDTHTPGRYACTFCGKKQEDVRKIVVGPRAFICDECICLCNTLLDESDLVPSPGEFIRVLNFLLRMFRPTDPDDFEKEWAEFRKIVEANPSARRFRKS